MPSSPTPTWAPELLARAYYSDDSVVLIHGDCLDVLAAMPADSVDAIVTDPPYGLEFMGKAWDSFRVVPSGGAGNTSTGYTDGATRLARPSFTGSPNPSCVNCGGTQRGAEGQGVKRCRCAAPEFPNVRAKQMRAFGDWCESWAVECLRVLKPGGHMLAFGGTRTWHRLACAAEDAGFEMRDSIAWLYGSGFPKSLDVGKAIDRAAGAEREVVGPDPNWRARVHSESTYDGGQSRPEHITAPATPAAQQWDGWGTALKPAFEPIVVARKPLAGTVAENVLAHGTGALNIDGCRVATDDALPVAGGTRVSDNEAYGKGLGVSSGRSAEIGGRWPANVILDESQAAALDAMSGTLTSGANPTRRGSDKFRDAYGDFKGQAECTPARGADTGGASRFFYTAKAASDERPKVGGIAHPTVKPLDLMRWLVRLVTPPGGVVLDPFAGSGTTLEAAIVEGFRCIGIEREADYLPLIDQRIARACPPLDFTGEATA